jgi:hypothetical protein
MHSSEGRALDATGVQLHGLLDAVASYEGSLGYSRGAGGKQGTISVWAPTAQSVELLRWPGPRDGPPPDVHLMTRGGAGAGVRRGVWSLENVPLAWEGSYYRCVVLMSQIEIEIEDFKIATRVLFGS